MVHRSHLPTHFIASSCGKCRLVGTSQTSKQKIPCNPKAKVKNTVRLSNKHYSYSVPNTPQYRKGKVHKSSPKRNPYKT